MWLAGTVSRFTWFACGNISFTRAMPSAMVFAVPPLSWMVMAFSVGPWAMPWVKKSASIRFAAEPDHEHAAEVGVARVAGERAPQDVHALPGRVHAAAGRMRERDHAIHVGEVLERVALEGVGDVLGDRRRAVHRREDADVV